MKHSINEINSFKSTWIFNFCTNILNLEAIENENGYTFIDKSIHYPTAYILNNADAIIRKTNRNTLRQSVLNKRNRSHLRVFPLGKLLYMAVKYILHYRIINGKNIHERTDAKLIYTVFNKKCKFQLGTDYFYAIRFIANKRGMINEFPSHENLSVYEKNCLGIKQYETGYIKKVAKKEQVQIQKVAKKEQVQTDFSTVMVDLQVSIETIEKSRNFKAVIKLGNEILKEYPPQKHIDHARQLVSQDIKKLKVQIIQIDE